MVALPADWIFSQDTQELDPERIKKLHREFHAQLEPTRKFYENAGTEGQWRRYISPHQTDVCLISEALIVTEDCSLKTPLLIQRTIEAYKVIMLDTPDQYPELSCDPEKKRRNQDRFGKKRQKKIRTEKCRNMANVICALLRQTSLKTKLVGLQSSNGYFYGVTTKSLMRDTKLSREQVSSSLRTLRLQGCISVTQRKVAIKNDDGTTTWRQRSNVYKITEFFLKKLGKQQAWKRAAENKVEAEKIKRQKANAEAQEKAGKAASDAKLKGQRRESTTKTTETIVQIEIVGSSKTIIKRAKDQKENHKEKTNPHYAEFKELSKKLLGL